MPNISDMFRASIDGSTVKILDEYIKSQKQYFYITTTLSLIHDNKVFDIHFIISNKIPIDKKIVSTNITMTEFKQLFKDDFYNCYKILNYKNRLEELNRCSTPKLSIAVFDFLDLFYTHFKEHYNKSKNKDLILFDNPISVNAQSCSNRTGYGNEYYCDTLMYEGTKYGETSEFPIVGYIPSFYGKIKDAKVKPVGGDMWSERYISSKYL
nr:MAG TPA: hypothetical protein [Caudoviricetes sp.]